MDLFLQPWQLYFVVLVGWVQRQQREVIEYLMTENRTLKELHGNQRILLNDDQRRRLCPAERPSPTIAPTTCARGTGVNAPCASANTVLPVDSSNRSLAVDLFSKLGIVKK